MGDTEAPEIRINVNWSFPRTDIDEVVVAVSRVPGINFDDFCITPDRLELTVAIDASDLDAAMRSVVPTHLREMYSARVEAVPLDVYATDDESYQLWFLADQDTPQVYEQLSRLPDLQQTIGRQTLADLIDRFLKGGIGRQELSVWAASVQTGPVGDELFTGCLDVFGAGRVM